MQDRAIARIGHWQLEKNKELEPVDLYIENMFPGKDYQILLLQFEITNNNNILSSNYVGIDIQKVGAETESYLKYAYRNGSPNGGDITFTTLLSIGKRSDIFSNLKKKLSKTKNRFSEIEKFNCNNNYSIEDKTQIEFEKNIFKSISILCSNKYLTIVRQLISRLQALDTKVKTEGISIRIILNSNERHLNDFTIIKELILRSGSETKFINQGEKSIAKNKRCSITGNIEKEIYGFAAPFSFSSPDKTGSISGFFNKRKNWRNYPISSKQALPLELGKRFVLNNLRGYFYIYSYLIIPHPILSKDTEQLEKLINLLKIAFHTEKEEIEKNEKQKRVEDYIMRFLGEQNDFFMVDLLFFETKNAAFKIKLNLEEILPSRFRLLFIDIPEKVNKNQLYKDVKQEQELYFSFQIVKTFFEESFLDIVQKIFLGKPISTVLLYEKIIKQIQKNYNKIKTQGIWTEPGKLVIKAIMLISYLQELNVITNNKTYHYMGTEVIEKKESRFNLEGFNEFVKSNSGFLDSDIKVGIFSVGVLVRFLFDIQQASLRNTPFENKLRGYKLNPDLLTTIYTEALDKIQKYQKNFYVYTDLREIINQYYITKKYDIKSLNNNELSFYFVSGLEMGRKFKTEKDKPLDEVIIN